LDHLQGRLHQSTGGSNNSTGDAASIRTFTGNAGGRRGRPKTDRSAPTLYYTYPRPMTGIRQLTPPHTHTHTQHTRWTLPYTHTPGWCQPYPRRGDRRLHRGGGCRGWPIGDKWTNLRMCCYRALPFNHFDTASASQILWFSKIKNKHLPQNRVNLLSVINESQGYPRVARASPLNRVNQSIY
jgi:hypothetical protein